MLLTGHKTRTIFDRYNIVNEQELLEAGDQLVAYLEQHAQATPRGAGADLCRMFNAAMHGRGAPRHLSTDHDPLFEATGGRRTCGF